jgi:hypothetical protein
MSVNGINNSPLPTVGSLLRPDAARTNATQPGLDRAAAARANATAALKPQAPIAGQATQSAVPAEPPAGTDPELWSVLTTEERSFFAKSSALGPLTYGRYKAELQPPTPPAARGIRLDVRA